jgi:hypothetical protein
MIELPINFFPKPSTENRNAIEFFELQIEAVTSTQILRAICTDALKKWVVKGAVPYYLSECYKPFEKGAACQDLDLKAFLTECLGLWIKASNRAALYGIGYVRDVEACLVWDWLISCTINLL